MNIKLVIWDLDDTFWQGTLSEGKIIPIDENVSLVKLLNQKGIINSICSKNDYNDARERLIKLDNIWDYFVFPSINWESKATRVASIIKKMSLRAENVLFVDDNNSNLEEVKYYLNDINVMHADNIHSLYEQVYNLEDEKVVGERLNKYKILEKKSADIECSENNEEFLIQSIIKVEIKHDCEVELDRIHELILRTNQLNFTKDRITKEALNALICDTNKECGYIKVSDRYGDYGVVGFYVINLGERRLQHFLFSCRTLGMGIEQYVYQQLGYPDICVIGDVAGTIEKKQIVNWINNVEQNDLVSDSESCGVDNINLFVKGPCDVSSIVFYIKEQNNIKTEFNYVDDNGVTITGHNHSSMVVQSQRITNDDIKKILVDAPFYSEKNFHTDFLKENASVYIYSLLPDGHDGVYKHKKTGKVITFSSGNFSLCNPDNWDDFINDKYSNHGIRFKKEELEHFSHAFDFLGFIDSNDTVENLKTIRSMLPKESLLILLLGSTVECSESKINHRGVHVRHKLINDGVYREFSNADNIMIVDATNYIKSEKDYRDNIADHYSRSVYYKLAREVVDDINVFFKNKEISVDNTTNIIIKGIKKIFN